MTNGYFWDIFGIISFGLDCDTDFVLLTGSEAFGLIGCVAGTGLTDLLLVALTYICVCSGLETTVFTGDLDLLCYFLGGICKLFNFNLTKIFAVFS